MTRAEIMAKYGICARLKPSDLTEELTPRKAKKFENVCKTLAEHFDEIYESEDESEDDDI